MEEEEMEERLNKCGTVREIGAMSFQLPILLAS
jgi:hypothetical protein